MYMIFLAQRDTWKDNTNLLQLMGLMFAALCHDTDHRGFTNSFIQLSNNPLYQLYGDASMENHHVFIALIIIEVKLFFLFILRERDITLIENKFINVYTFGVI